MRQRVRDSDGDSDGAWRRVGRLSLEILSPRRRANSDDPGGVVSYRIWVTGKFSRRQRTDLTASGAFGMICDGIDVIGGRFDH